MYVSCPTKGFFSPVGHWAGRVEQEARIARYPIPAALMEAGAILARPGEKGKGGRLDD